MKCSNSVTIFVKLSWQRVCSFLCVHKYYGCFVTHLVHNTAQSAQKCTIRLGLILFFGISLDWWASWKGSCMKYKYVNLKMNVDKFWVCRSNFQEIDCNRWSDTEKRSEHKIDPTTNSNLDHSEKMKKEPFHWVFLQTLQHTCPIYHPLWPLSHVVW